MYINSYSLAKSMMTHFRGYVKSQMCSLDLFVYTDLGHRERERERDPPLSSAEVKESVELYIYTRP